MLKKSDVKATDPEIPPGDSPKAEKKSGKPNLISLFKPGVRGRFTFHHTMSSSSHCGGHREDSIISLAVSWTEEIPVFVVH